LSAIGASVGVEVEEIMVDVGVEVGE
jgi:hypothetical protein